MLRRTLCNFYGNKYRLVGTKLCTLIVKFLEYTFRYGLNANNCNLLAKLVILRLYFDITYQ